MRPRSFILASSFAALTVLAAACATGTSDGDLGGNDDDDETTTGSGGNGAAGGQATVGGASSSSTATSGGGPSTGGGGGGPACAEDPCKLVEPQCGCPAGEQCVIGAPSAQNPGGRACTAAGTGMPGEPCAGNGDCAPGSMCVNTGVDLCLEFCSTDATCNAPGGQCLITLVDANEQTIPDALLCSLNCDPITNTGCNAGGCSLGQEQVTMELFTLCQAVGAGTQGTTCVDNGDCAGGFGCFNTDLGMQCLKYCGVTPSKGSCTGGTVCTGFTTPILLGNQEYGVCI